ncbi:MAG: CBS domain-containing protein [Alphaproteobacteria bacterium]
MASFLTQPFAAMFQRLRRAKEMESLNDDLHAAWKERAERPLSKSERELLGNALVFSSVTANDVCVPRADIKVVSTKAGFGKVMKVFAESHYSRLPVMGKSLDDIVGVITLKDMAPFVGKEGDFVLANCLRPPLFVPETMPVPRVLQLMKRHRIGLVMVTDEYGGVTGLLTLKDLLGELVGELGDEHDEAVPEGIQSVGNQRFRMPATLLLEDVTRTLALTWNLPDTLEIETVGGLVMHEARRVPAAGETVNLPNGVVAKVLVADARHVEVVELKLPDKLSKASKA